MSLVVAAAVALGCDGRSKPVDDTEVFTTRTLALGYLRRGQLPEAEEQFKKLIALVPDDRLGYADLGLTYLQGGRYREAETQLRRARELDSTNAEVGLLMAKLYSLTGRNDEARSTLEQIHDSTANARVLFALAELEAQQSDSAALRRREERLRRVLVIAPANVAVRVQLLAVLARRGQTDNVLQQLEELRRIPPEPAREARPYLTSALRLLQDGKLAEAREPLDRFIAVLEGTVAYQASLDEVRWAEAPLVGRPVLQFAATHLITLRGVRETATIDSVQFLDVTDEAGLFDPRSRTATRTEQTTASAGPTALAAGDVDGDGDDDVFVSFWSPEQQTSVAHLYFVQGGFARDMTERAGIAFPNGAKSATFADIDNDGWLDLFVITSEGGGRGYLLRNRGNSTFEDVTAKAGIARVNGAAKALFADLEHDGDLDLVLVGSNPLAVYRNNQDGTFSDGAASFGLPASVVRGAAFGDFNSDGRIDILLPSETGGIRLFQNGGAQGFSDVTLASGLATIANSAGSTLAVGDSNNDGALDLFVASADGASHGIWLGKGDGTFALDRRSSNSIQIRSSTAQATEFVDYDNDGWLDLVIAGKPQSASDPGVFVFRNNGSGSFVHRSTIVPQALRLGGATALEVTDIDEDGDEDLLISDLTSTVRLLRNEGGNNNMAVRVELKGLRTGSGKNNVFGIGARLELRAGGIYQTRVVTGRVTHFGLGPHLKADVLRVEWPNGVPQTIYLPGSDHDVVEAEMLKGSCAFVYAWDGTEFRFVTDVMWRSALGMPLGLMGTSSRFAPAGASQEYLRIPGRALRSREGRYTLQFTEELWETAYTDEIKLIAVDHPDSVEVFVDERFVPPGPVKMRILRVVRPHAPLSATDEHGNDLLPALREHDAKYVSNLTPMQYQGVVEPHDLILDLGESAGRAGTHLFLRGWIYPTDASINVALSQQSSVKVLPPSLEVRHNGKWVSAIPDIGFPSGKDKTIAIDLTGKFPGADHRVRIRTSMQIYWDQALVGGDVPSAPVQITSLTPVSGDLHFRGFSRMYRKGGRYGPHWFAYDDVSKESPWRRIEGAFTRFGDVLPLLQRADDMYVIMGPGDEMTVQFDASSERALMPGWKRDFLLYTDGWIKDSDLNTAFGTTVEPLPFHQIKEYPYGPRESYPNSAEHQRYLREYNSRVLRSKGVKWIKGVRVD
ncbi:MAG: FG-GAP-like repeat-containing protein [Gemmatimonadaceae bacterium]